MWWRHEFIGHPEEVIVLAQKVANFKHDGTDAGDLHWDGVVEDLEAAIAHWKRACYGGCVTKLPDKPIFDWPYALICHGGNGQGFEPKKNENR